MSTWNVGGKAPPSNMNLDDWIHSAPPADIYVLGYESMRSVIWIENRHWVKDSRLLFFLTCKIF